MATKMSNSIMVAADEDWRVESDLRTILDAEEIRNDKKRWDKVRALAKKKLMTIAAVASDEDD